MSLAFRTTMVTIKGLTHGLCRIDSRSLEQVPAQGPLILVCNHINFLESVEANGCNRHLPADNHHRD